MKFSCLSIFRLSNLSCTISLGNGGEAFLIYLATLQFHNNFDSKEFLTHTIFHNTNDCLYMAQSHFLIQYWHLMAELIIRFIIEHIQHYCTDERKRACISVPICLFQAASASQNGHWPLQAAWKDKLGLRYALSFSRQCSNVGCGSAKLYMQKCLRTAI